MFSMYYIYICGICACFVFVYFEAVRVCEIHGVVCVLNTNWNENNIKISVSNIDTSGCYHGANQSLKLYQRLYPNISWTHSWALFKKYHNIFYHYPRTFTSIQYSDRFITSSYCFLPLWWIRSCKFWIPNLFRSCPLVHWHN